MKIRNGWDWREDMLSGGKLMVIIYIYIYIYIL
jgi:hypothetical protein